MMCAQPKGDKNFASANKKITQKENKILIAGLGLLMACGANAAPKGVKSTSGVSRTDWSGAQWSGELSYYNPASVDQKYFGEQVYYGEENYGIKIAQKMKEDYGVDLYSIMGMCSKSGGVIGSYVKDGKQPKSNKNGDSCWCSLTVTGGDTPWFFLSGAVMGTEKGVEKSYCARNCAYSCAKYIYDYLYPDSDVPVLFTNAQELIEYTVNMGNN